ncbi:MAG: SPOR domain-containing protein [Bacteroidales bacterium]
MFILRISAMTLAIRLMVAGVSAQPVTLEFRMPDEIPAGRETEVELIVNKGSLEGFARFQQTFPAGIMVVPVESAYADFAYDAGKLNLIWLKLPSDPVVRVVYRLKPDPKVKGTFKLGGKFSYLIENNRNDLEIENRTVRILPAPGTDPSALVDIADYTPAAGQKTVTGSPEASVSAAQDSYEINAYRQKPVPDASGKGYVVKVLLEKGSWNRSGILEEDILNQFEARPLETLGARFTFESGRARFVWLRMPADPYLVVSYELVPRVAGQNPAPSVQGKFSLVEGNDARQVMVSQRSFELNSTSQRDLAAVAAGLRLDTGSTESLPVVRKTGETVHETDRPVQKTPAPAGIVFRVQVGAYSRPVNVNTFFKSMNLQDDVQMDRHAGLYKYTVGNFSSYREARGARDRIARSSLVDEPFVCAFRDGRRIPVDEALRLTNQEWFK